MASGFARFVRKIKGAAYTDLQNAVRYVVFFLFVVVVMVNEAIW